MQGVSLIEVMAALVVLSIGILGFTTLQTASLNFNSEAAQRTQATVLSSAMADRMRANRRAALNGEYNLASGSSTPDCSAIPSPCTIANQDIWRWRDSLQNRLPASTSAITRVGDEFTLTVTWDNSRGQQPPEQFQVTTSL